MSIRLQNEVAALEKRVAALEDAVSELHRLLQAMTRQSTQRGRAA